MSLPLISKILSDCEKISGRKDKIKFLRSHHPNKTMKILLKYAFDKNIEFVLPDGNPPYKEADDYDSNGGMYAAQRKLYLFIKGGNTNLHPVRRESLFIEVLESLHPAEAKLLLAVKDKIIPYKGITEKLVKEAFPGLIS